MKSDNIKSRGKSHHKEKCQPKKHNWTFCMGKILQACHQVAASEPRYLTWMSTCGEGKSVHNIQMGANRFWQQFTLKFKKNHVTGFRVSQGRWLGHELGKALLWADPAHWSWERCLLNFMSWVPLFLHSCASAAASFHFYQPSSSGLK